LKKKNNSNLYVISLILVLSFSKGLLAIFGVNETISQLIIEVLIVLLFMKSLLNVLSTRVFIAPAFLINLALLLLILFSYLLTDVNSIKLVLFIRNFFIYYLFFYALFNLNLTLVDKEKIKKLIIYLFFLQVVAAFIKLFIIGKTENFIGTMSIAEGSLATIMPLFAIVYLLSNYIVYKNINYIIIMLFFIAIGLISNKIGIIFYIGILYLYLIYIYSNSKSIFLNITFIKKFFMSIIYFSIIFSLFISLNPRTNPEGIVGGSVDIEYLMDYSESYQTLSTRKSMGIEGDGRFDAPGVAFRKMGEGGLINILFGFGPGELVKSSLTAYKNPLLDKYHIGYGGRIGLVWTMMQIGLIGLFIFLSFHMFLYRRVKSLYNQNIDNNEYKIYLMTFLGISIIYFLDFFTYSPSMILNPGLVLVYFYAYYYVDTYTATKEEISNE
jgi:hypothetical protein